MNLKITAITEPGGMRKNNEDRILIGSEILTDGCKNFYISLGKDTKYVCAVADGIGGHEAGEIAAELVLRSLCERTQSLEANLTHDELKNLFQKWANETHMRLLEEGERNAKFKGMGTTLIALIFYEGMAYYINAGDSRLYRFRDGLLVQISEDHSLKAVSGIESHVILNSIGGGETSFIDFKKATQRLMERDIFVLCSDGLTDVLTDEEIEVCLGFHEGAAEELVRRAKERGAPDNISVAIVCITIVVMKTP